jgi:pimeloyl-ACP methyl ester carboxylesterase
VDGVQASGAAYRICRPEASCWNGDLVVYAHGYVGFNEPVAIPESHLVLDGVPLPSLMNALGYAFAATSYSTNGLAILPGVDDVVDLVDVFTDQHGAPGKAFLVGPSEGGIVTTLALERHPDVFAGGVSACGPIGDFGAQLNYWGDFRVLFDVYFPGLVPGSAVSVPPAVIADWYTVYQPAVIAALQARPAALDELLRVANVPFDAARPASKVESVIGLLWYNVFATNDGVAKLGGQPFENRARVYSRSSNDLLLNALVARHAADPAAAAEIARHQTVGIVSRPMITLHTTGDPIIPWAHEILYYWKTLATGGAPKYANLPVARYGHCQFTATEALFSFLVVALQANLDGGTTVPPAVLTSRFGTAARRIEAGAIR